MSARPRPVTATVNPPLPLNPLHGPRTMLSSDGSTESLISVLDHDSYESPSFSDVESDVKECLRSSSTRRTSSASQSEVHHKTRPSASPPPSGRLTPWEDWMVRKARELRIGQEKQVQQLNRRQKEKACEAKEKAVIQKRGMKMIHEWNERKVLELKTRKKVNKQCQNAEQELKEVKRLDLERKAKANFEEWQQHKKAEEKAKREKEQECKDAEETQKAERQHKCEEKYKEWLKQAKKRPKSAPHSYGYAQGKLTGFYDRAAYPSPGFFNPIPWQPIPVPNEHTAPPDQPRPTKKKERKRLFRPKPNS